MAYQLAKKLIPDVPVPEGHTWIPDGCTKKHIPTGLLVLMCYYSQKYHRLPTLKEAADWMKVTIPTVIKQRSRLVQLGYLELIETGRNQSSISESLRWEIWERDNFTCRRCGSRRFLAVDHIYPKSKGGSDQRENLQTLCKKCNTAKSDRIEEGA